MGYAISWFAVSGKDPQEVIHSLGLKRTGERQEIPEFPISAATLHEGWLLIFLNKFDSSFVSDGNLKQLSNDCRVISCQIEEHVMFSSAACFSNGKSVWRVIHDAQKNIYDLSANGELPPEFNEIVARLKKEQDEAGGEKADVDYIHDIPVVLAKSITSFRHDEEIRSDDPRPFEQLVRDASRSPPKPWWKVW